MSDKINMLVRISENIIQQFEEVEEDVALLIAKDVVMATYNSIIRFMPDRVNALGVGELWLQKNDKDVEWKWKNLENESFDFSWSLSKLVRRVVHTMNMPFSGISDFLSEIVPHVIFENRDPWGAFVVIENNSSITVATWEAADRRNFSTTVYIE